VEGYSRNIGPKHTLECPPPPCHRQRPGGGGGEAEKGVAGRNSDVGLKRARANLRCPTTGSSERTATRAGQWQPDKHKRATKQDAHTRTPIVGASGPPARGARRKKNARKIPRAMPRAAACASRGRYTRSVESEEQRRGQCGSTDEEGGAGGGRARVRPRRRRPWRRRRRRPPGGGPRAARERAQTVRIRHQLAATVELLRSGHVPARAPVWGPGPSCCLKLRRVWACRCRWCLNRGHQWAPCRWAVVPCLVAP